MRFAVRHASLLIAIPRTVALRIVLPGISLFFAVCPGAEGVLAAADVTQAVELYRTGKYDECVRVCEAVIAKDEYGETWRLLKIQSELSRGRYPEALASLEQALPAYSTSVRLHWLGAEVCRYNGDEARSRRLLDEIEKLVLGAAWRYTDPASRVTLGRFYVQRGIDAKQVLEATWNAVKRQNPAYAEAYVAAGQLALAKHDYALAAEEFGKALKHDGTDPDIHFGLARAYQPSDDARSAEHLELALARNPRHIESLLMRIDSLIDAERYAESRELLDEIMQVNILEPRAWAYRAVLAHLHGETRNEAVSRSIGLAWWTTNPEVDHILGRKLSQKYRFREGAEYQRQALSLDPHYVPAKVQLSQDLLRLGQEADGWRLAQEVFDADGYNVVAHNLTRLRDHLGKFQTLEKDGVLVRMDAREAAVYGNRVLDLLGRAKQTLATKYDVELPTPILVEIFPEQQDFAIRTFGLPGGDGFLGVCFGSVITANSSATRTDQPVNWESVLWHEFCHVATLHKTRNKMPRWLSEGISVYEERQADATWGQSMSAANRRMILNGQLTPVSQLSGAFLNAPSPGHLQFAYFESSLVVEYLIERYGFATLNRILTDLGVGMPINDALERSAGSLAALDQEFDEYARKQAAAFAAQADWATPDLSPAAGIEAWTAWLNDHPNNYEALQRVSQSLIRDGRWEEAKVPLRKMVELNPIDPEPMSMLANVHRRLDETADELAILQRWAGTSADASAAYLRLVELYTAQENWSGLQRAASQLVAVNPMLAASYRGLSRAAQETGDDEAAISALRTTLLLAPVDAVDLRFRLSELLRKNGNLREAKRQVLMALEDAPRFRAGHRQLLEIVRELAKRDDTQPPAPDTESKGERP